MGIIFSTQCQFVLHIHRSGYNSKKPRLFLVTTASTTSTFRTTTLCYSTSGTTTVGGSKWIKIYIWVGLIQNFLILVSRLSKKEELDWFWWFRSSWKTSSLQILPNHWFWIWKWRRIFGRRLKSQVCIKYIIVYIVLIYKKAKNNYH